MANFSKRTLFARAALLIAMAILFSVFYISYSQRDAQSRAFSLLSEISEQGNTRLNMEIHRGLNNLEIMSSMMTCNSENDCTNMIEQMRPLVEKYNFVRIGIADAQGNVLTTDAKTFNIAERDHFKQAIKGIPNISDALYDYVDGRQILVYAVPIYHNQRVVKVLFSTYAVDRYRNALSVPSFDGEGFSYIISSDGRCVVGSNHPNSIGRNFTNLFDVYLSHSSRNQSFVNQLQSDIAAGASGVGVAHYVSDKYIYYRPVGVNNWYLISVVPVSVVMQSTNRMLLWSYLFLVLCLLIIILLVIDSFRTRLDAYKKLEHIAYVDELTGGLSFNKFKQEATQILQENPTSRFAMISLDVDNFQYINDVYGYTEGDNALRFLWRTLQDTCLVNEICARVYGDHFVFLAQYEHLDELETRFRQVTAQLHSYFPSSGSQLGYNFAVSAGVYPIDFSIIDIDTMVNRARIPQKRIKGLASSGFEFYTDILHQELIRNKAIENQFSTALANGEFVAYYQPKYDIKNSRYFGAEALVRWQKPQGLMPPASFIPVFEQNGDIVQLDMHMLEMVCADLRRWLNAGIPVSPVSVNVSHLQLLHTNFVPDYLEVLSRHQIPTNLIELEFTETVMVQNAVRLTNAAEELHEHAFRVLIDDFGSGYSSLGMLKNVPLDVLKLDRSFVIDLDRDQKARDVVVGALALAHTLGMTVTAEGVETKAQFDILKDAGCDSIQGFYCAKPMPASEYEDILSGRTIFTL